MEFDIVRAWKDAQYRQSLSAEQQTTLPESPVGGFELSEADLEAVSGAGQEPIVTIAGKCFFTGGDEETQCPTIASEVNGSCRSKNEEDNNNGNNNNNDNDKKPEMGLVSALVLDLL